MQRVSFITITAPEPSIDPAFATESKSMSVAIMMSAGSTGIDEPPGITALSFPASRILRHCEQRRERRAERNLEIAGMRDVARHRKYLGAAVIGTAQVEEGVAAVVDDVRHCGKRFGVVDRGRLAVEAVARRKRRLEARLAFLALDGFKQRGFLAADVGTPAMVIVELEAQIRAENVGAEIAGGARLLDRLLHAFVHFPDLAVNEVADRDARR